MGIETISGITGASSYQSQTVQAAKPSAQVGETTTKNVNEVVADTAQSSVSSQAVVVGQATQSGQSEAGSSDAKKQENKEASMKDLKNIQKVINNNTIAEFGYNEPTKRITIKIKDKETDEVIKEIPSDKALEMLAKAWELAGLLVDEKR